MAKQTFCSTTSRILAHTGARACGWGGVSEGRRGGIWRLTLGLAKRGPLELVEHLELLECLHAPRDQHKPHHVVRVVPQLIHLIHLEKGRARGGPPGFWRRVARVEPRVQLLRVRKLITGAENSVPRALRRAQPLPIDEAHARQAAPLVFSIVG
eukprot:scaffold15083_cov66-Phaeocystis_antarctica.AAC.2